MPYCPDCGVEVGEGAAFCRSCGTALDEPMATDAPAEPAGQSTSQATTTPSPDDDAPTTARETTSSAIEMETLPDADRLRTRLQGMDGYEFEHFVADLWERMGWQTSVSQASNDAGIDVVAEKASPYPQKKVIQAKRYSDSTTVGSPDIQQYASLRHQVADADSVVIVTTSRFTNSAENRAEELNVKLVDGDALIQMIDELDALDLLEEYLTIHPDPGPGVSSAPAGTEAVGDSAGTGAAEVDVEAATDEAPSEIGKPDGSVDLAPLTHWNRWHWVATVFGVVTFVTVGGDAFGPAGDVFLIPGLVLTGVSMYIDIERVREISEWDPSAWLYLGGLMIIFITIPWYLFNRARHVGL